MGDMSVATNGMLNGLHEDPEDTLNGLDRSWTKNRKITDYDVGAGARQRKISHRKVIIHDDGEICNKTYNKVMSAPSLAS